MSKVVDKIVQGFDFSSVVEFGQSLAPSTKYHLTLLTVTLSSIIGYLSAWFGLQPTTIFAFILLATLELATGIWASIVTRKQSFESRKIGRFTLKLLMWLTLVFILNAYRKEFKDTSTLHAAFEYIFYAVFTWISLEYLVSVGENIAVIKGKPKTHYVDHFKDKLLGIFKSSGTVKVIAIVLLLSSCSRKPIATLQTKNTDSTTIKNNTERITSDVVSYKDTSLVTPLVETNLTIMVEDTGMVLEPTVIRNGNAELTLSISKGFLSGKCKCDSLEFKAKIMQRTISNLESKLQQKLTQRRANNTVIERAGKGSLKDLSPYLIIGFVLGLLFMILLRRTVSL